MTVHARQEALPPPKPRWLVLPPLTPGLIVLATGVVLVALDGGFPPKVWYPVALFIVALAVVAVLVAPPQAAEWSRRLTALLLVYGCFVAWSYASMLWADAPGDAWYAANRALLYGLVLLAAVLKPWTRRESLVGLALIAFGLTAVAVGALGTVAGAEDPAGFFVHGRLSEPTGYTNSTAAAWLMGFWPAVCLATTRLLSWPLRGVCLAAATALGQTAILSQSRGAAIAFGITAVIFIALTPRRWPVLFALAVVAGVTAVSFESLTQVRQVSGTPRLGDEFDAAVVAIALSSLAAGSAGAAAALAGRRVTSRAQSHRWLATTGRLALIGLVIAGLTISLIAIGNPVDWAEARWADFKQTSYSKVEAGSTRFVGGLGSGRYDYYRVALNEFRDHPLTGVGGDNFAADYLISRRTPEAPRHPHSMVFRLLGQLGVVGTALFAAFVLLAGWTVVAARPGASLDGRAIVAGATGGVLAFFIHSLADWLWAFQGLGVLAFALLGLAARTGWREDGEASPGLPVVMAPATGPSHRPAAVGVPVALLVLAAALSLALPGIASRYTSSAYDGFRKDPAQALSRLDRAAELNPLSAEPLVAKGVIAQRIRRYSVALPALRQAVDREPRNWFAFLELAMVEQRLGAEQAARRSVARAARLNPRQPVVAQVRRRIGRGRDVDAAAVERALFGQLQSLVGADTGD